MENVEEAQRFLAEYGWQASLDPHLDKRAVHPLSPFTQPPSSPRRQAAKSPPSRPRSRQDGVRVRQSVLQLTRELSKLTNSFQKPKDGADSPPIPSDRGKAELLERQSERVRKFNALGVFKPSVSVIRARAMYHVELARRLKSVDLNRRMSCKPIEPRGESTKEVLAPATGLHSKLDKLLSTDPTTLLLNQLSQFPSQRADRRKTRRQTRLKTNALAKEPSRLDLMVQERTRQLVTNVQARTQEAVERAKAEMVARYRSHVTDIEKQVKEHANETRLARLASSYRVQADVRRTSEARASGADAPREEGLEGEIRRAEDSAAENGSRKESIEEKQSAIDERTLERLAGETSGRPSSRENQMEDESRSVSTAEGETAAALDGALRASRSEYMRASSFRRTLTSRIGRPSTCYKTRNAQKWAALESSLPFRVTDPKVQRTADDSDNRSSEADATTNLGSENGRENWMQNNELLAEQNDQEDTVEKQIESDSIPIEVKESELRAPNPNTFGIAELFQARLERVWEVLGTPTSAKVDMVIKYTSRDNSHRLEEALQCWEAAAAAVVAHERALQEWDAAYPAPFEPTDAFQEEQLLREQISLAQGVIQSAANSHETVGALKLTFGDDLLVQGSPYESRLQAVAQVETVLNGLKRRREELERHAK